MLWRIHHCIADGIALSRVLLSVTDAADPAIRARPSSGNGPRHVASPGRRPGRGDRLGFAGVPVEGVLVWAPCSGSLGMTVSIFSYAGEVTVGFMVDTALFADPEPLSRAYERELDLLCG